MRSKVQKNINESNKVLGNLTDKQLEYHSSETKKELGRSTIHNNRSTEASSKGGKIGGPKAGKKAKEEKLGFHALSTEERQFIGKRVGDKVGPRSYKEGFGIFGLSEEEKRKNAIAGGKISGKSPKNPNNIRIKCEHCGFETSVLLYKRWHGDKCKHKK